VKFLGRRNVGGEPNPADVKKTFKKSTLNWGVRIGASVLLGLVLWWHWRTRAHLGDMYEVFLVQLRHAEGRWLLLALLLMPLNLLAEAHKWRYFVQRYEPISLWRAFGAVLTGTSFAVFTPQRVGEYGGRILYVRAAHHWKAIAANLMSSISQLLVLTAGGFWGLVWLSGRLTDLSGLLQLLLGACCVVALAVGFWLYFHLGTVLDWLERQAWMQRFSRYLNPAQVLRDYSKADLWFLLRWSTVRYVVFSTQYVLLLHFFGLPVGWIDGWAGVALLFLLQTGLPLPAVAGLAARGGLAVYIWRHFGANDLGSLSSSFSLWIINLVFPALTGTFLLFYVNITKMLGYEKADLVVYSDPVVESGDTTRS
jgi:Lysylphosphatidylglycerol synthase TM region